MGKKTVGKKEKGQKKVHNITKRIRKGGQAHNKKQVRLLFSKKKTGPGIQVMTRVFAKPSIRSNAMDFGALSHLFDAYIENIEEMLSVIKRGDKEYPKKEEIVDIYVGDGDIGDNSTNSPVHKQARLLFSKNITNPEISTNIRIFAKPSMPESMLDIAGISKLMKYYAQNVEEQFAIFKYGESFPKRERVIDIYLGRKNITKKESSEKKEPSK
jgi:hypothetical protein